MRATLKRYYKKHDMMNDYYRLEKSFWPRQGNDYFLLKMPDWLIEKLKVSTWKYSSQFKYDSETFVPIDAKLKNVILYMWNLGVYTKSVSEPGHPKDMKGIGQISIKKNGKNFLDSLKKILNDDIFVTDKKRFSIISRQHISAIDGGDKFTLFFTDKGLDILESAFNIEKADISKALPGYNRIKK